MPLFVSKPGVAWSPTWNEEKDIIIYYNNWFVCGGFIKVVNSMDRSSPFYNRSVNFSFLSKLFTNF
jgi:hypothetical protein